MESYILCALNNLLRYVTLGLLVQWVLIVLLWPQGFLYLIYLYHMGTWQFQGTDYDAIFPFTFASALALFSFSFYALRFRFHLSWFRTILFSISLPFAATSLFEEIYQDIGLMFHTPFIAPTVDAHLINVSCILFGMISIAYWRPTRVLYFAAIAYVSLWAIWVWAGYPQIYEQIDFAIPINIALKVLSYSLFVLLVFGKLISNTRISESRLEHEVRN